MFWWSNKMKWFNFARMHKNRLKIKYLYGSAFPVPKIQNDATAIMDFMDCIVYNNINRTRHASQRCWACRVIYKNVTDVVTDNVTNKRTVTFRATDKDGAQKNQIRNVWTPIWTPKWTLKLYVLLVKIKRFTSVNRGLFHRGRF